MTKFNTSSLVIAMMVCATHASFSHAQATWTGATNQDWNTGTNWSANPPTGNFTINTATGNFPIISANNAWSALNPDSDPVDVFVGNGGGNSGRLDHRAGSLALRVSGTTGNWFMVGRSTGTGTYNLANTATVGGGISGFAQSSGSLTVGKLWVGGAAFGDNGTGTVNINTTGTLTANSNDFDPAAVIVGAYNTPAAIGTINLESGTIQAGQPVAGQHAEFWLGRAGSGTVNQSGGTVNSTSYFVIARGWTTQGGTGIYNLSGGTVNAATHAGLTSLASTQGGSGTLSVSGTGTFNTNNGILVGEAFFANSGTATGTVNISGTGLLNTGTGTGTGTFLGVNANSTGTVNLNGGTLATAVVKRGVGTGTFNFNGGTLRATAVNANFMTGLTTANVRNGGAVVDTNGFDVTIGQLLQHSYIGGDAAKDGGLTKNGGGILTLTAFNTYTGDIVINGGQLWASGDIGVTFTNSALGNLDDGLANPRSITIASGAQLSLITGNVLGTGGSANTLDKITLNVNGGTFATGLNGIGAGWWNKIGDVNLNAGLITIGSGANNTNFQGLALIGDVTVTGTAPSLINNQGGSNAAFNAIHLGQNAAAGQSIVFNVADVTGDANPDLTISARLINTSGNLTASGLTKTGAGTLTLTAANAYTGNTTLNAGTLSVGGVANTALGIGGTLLLNGGTLSSNNAGNTNFDPILANNITAAGGNIAAGVGTQLHLTGNISGSGALGLAGVFNGSGLRLEGNNAGYTGTATVTGANTRLGATTAGSAAAAWVVTGNLQTDVVGGGTFHLGSLSGAGNISGHANNGAAAVSTLSVGALGTNTTFSGTIINNAQNTAATGNTDGAANNLLALTKVGAGTLALSGANTYTGVTNVNQGTLEVNGTHTPAGGAGLYTIASGGTLKGSGITNGDLSVQGGTVAPGNSIESLGVGSMLFNGGTFQYEFNTATVTADLLYGDDLSTLDLDNNPILSLINLGSSANIAGAKFTLIAYDGLWDGGVFAGFADDLLFTFAGNQWLINYNDLAPGSNFTSDATSNGTRFVTILALAVPEPSMWRLALLATIGLALFAWRQRRHV